MKRLFLGISILSSGCANIDPARIPATPIVAAGALAIYPVALASAADAARTGDKRHVRAMLAAPITITRQYLEGED